MVRPAIGILAPFTTALAALRHPEARIFLEALFVPVFLPRIERERNPAILTDNGLIDHWMFSLLGNDI
jgi:hypothetical protein